MPFPEPLYESVRQCSSVSHLLHEALLGMRSVLFWPESGSRLSLVTPCHYPLRNVSSGTSVGGEGGRMAVTVQMQFESVVTEI